MNAAELFDALCNHYNVSPDRKGRAYVACPMCGKPSKRADVHFFFDAHYGGKCFVCGGTIGLRKMAELVGLYDNKPRLLPPPPPPKPEPPAPKWIERADDWAFSYETHTARNARWQAYKPVTSEEMGFYRLGYGTLPPYSSRCQHPRLILPIVSGESVIGFRARWDGCDCDAQKGKWLSALGTKTNLYNGSALTADARTAAALQLGPNIRSVFPKKIVAIVENPIDAIMFQRVSGMLTVATFGVSTWRDEWTKALVAYNPRLVIILYDHDLPGNGGSNPAEHAAMVRQWHDTHPEAKDAPPCNGIRLANALLEAGLPAQRYAWPKGSPLKYDIGAAIKDGIQLA